MSLPTCLTYTNAETYTNRHIHSQRKEYPWRYVRATKKIAYKKQNKKKSISNARLETETARERNTLILAGKKIELKKSRKRKKIKRQIANGTNAEESHTTTLQLRIESQNTKTYLQ